MLIDAYEINCMMINIRIFLIFIVSSFSSSKIMIFFLRKHHFMSNPMTFVPYECHTRNNILNLDRSQFDSIIRNCYFNFVIMLHYIIMINNYNLSNTFNLHIL